MKLIVIFLGSLYLMFAAWVYFSQDEQIFEKELSRKSVTFHDKNIKRFFHTTSDYTKLECAITENKEEKPLVIYFGGNANNALNFMNIVRDIKEYSFLTCNYRGYGNSEGEPSQQNIFSDALEIFDTYSKRFPKVYLVGRSLGSAVASYVASQRSTAGVVLITPFDSLKTLAKKRYPYLPVSLILKHPFETAEYISLTYAPVAVITAQYEDLIPPKSLKNLLGNIHNLVYQKVVPVSNHSTILNQSGFLPVFKEALKAISDEKDGI